MSKVKKQFFSDWWWRRKIIRSLWTGKEWYALSKEQRQIVLDYEKDIGEVIRLRVKNES